MKKNIANFQGAKVMHYTDITHFVKKIAPVQQTIIDKLLLFATMYMTGFNVYTFIPQMISILIMVIPWIMKRAYTWKYSYYSSQKITFKTSNTEYLYSEFESFSFDGIKMNINSEQDLFRMLESFTRLEHTSPPRIQSVYGGSVDLKHTVLQFKKALISVDISGERVSYETYAESDEYADTLINSKEKSADKNKIRLFTYDLGSNGHADRKETVIEPFSIFNDKLYTCYHDIIKALSSWKKNMTKYKKLGSSRISFVFHGKPGCGKTQLAHCICRYLGYKYIVQANIVGNKLLFDRKEKSVILFDDIDILFTYDRSSTEIKSELDLKRAELLDSFMKFLDSAECSESVIIFTTNYVDRFDKALFRKGRIDYTFHLDDLPVDNIEGFVQEWYELSPTDYIGSGLKPMLVPMSSSVLCNLIKQNIDDYKGFCVSYKESLIVKC